MEVTAPCAPLPWVSISLYPEGQRGLFPLLAQFWSRPLEKGLMGEDTETVGENNPAKVRASPGRRSLDSGGSLREGGGQGGGSETRGTYGQEPGRQAELLLPAQEPQCQLYAGGWARAGLPARYTHRAPFEEVAAVALPAPSNNALLSTGLGKLRHVTDHPHSRGQAILLR